MKNVPYRKPSYPTFLYQDVLNRKSCVEDHLLAFSEASEKNLEKSLSSKCSSPKDTLFRDDIFGEHLEKQKGRN